MLDCYTMQCLCVIMFVYIFLTLQNRVSNFLKIDAVNLTGDHYTYNLPTTLETCDFYCNDH